VDFYRTGEEFGGALLAVTEDALKLRAEEKPISEGAEGAEREFVLDLIEKRDAGLAIASGWAGTEMVAVTPVFEGAAELEVAEALVPGEVFDEGFPGKANGNKRQAAKAEGEARTGAGDEAGIMRRAFWTRRRRGEGGLLNAGTLPARKKLGKVLRVGEEGEDEGWRVR
jgi:hypothetical protein